VEYGVENTISRLQSRGQSYVKFLQLHFRGCVKANYLPLFREIIKILYNMPDKMRDFIHFRTENEDSVFRETALNYAVKNDHMLMVLELLKLEYQLHRAEEQVQTCLQETHCIETLPPWFNEIKARFSHFHFTQTSLGEFFLLIVIHKVTLHGQM
jgi:hypothetical protein